MDLADFEKREITPTAIAKALQRPPDFGWFGDEAMFETWSLGPVIEHRDSGLLDRANAIALQRALKTRPEWAEDWNVTEANHWAVGWVNHLSFRVVKADGTPTAIFKFITAWFDYLRESYPIADEFLYSELEADATSANIEQQAERLMRANPPDDWFSRVFNWFNEHYPDDLENSDDQGGWPTDEHMKECLAALGLLDDEDAE